MAARRLLASVLTTVVWTTRATAQDAPAEAAVENLASLEAPAADAATLATREATLLRLEGSEPFGRAFGRGAAGVGDLDGDGHADIAIGAGSRDSRAGSGAVLVYSGKDGSLLRSVIDPGAAGSFGWHLVPVRDVDGDGHVELAVQGSSLPRSTLSVVSPVDGRVLHTWSTGEEFDFLGHTAASVGDVDGDGVPDIVAGAFSARDRQAWIFFEVKPPPFARVYSGRTGEPIWTSEGESDFRYGETVQAAGDVDGDGVPDVAIAECPGAYFTGGPSASGRVWIVSGRDGSTLRRIDSTLHTDPFGRALASLGDVDGDGGPDLAIGSDQYPASFDRAQNGYARIVSLRDGRTLYTVTGRNRYDFFGQTLATLRDWDGDGISDLAIGAPQSGTKDGGPRPGYVLVVSGTSGTPIAEATGEPNTEFGICVADGGDVDGDSHPDLIVGAPGTQSIPGAVYVLSGAKLRAASTTPPAR